MILKTKAQVQVICIKYLLFAIS